MIIEDDLIVLLIKAEILKTTKGNVIDIDMYREHYEEIYKTSLSKHALCHFLNISVGAYGLEFNVEESNNPIKFITVRFTEHLCSIASENLYNMMRS